MSEFILPSYFSIVLISAIFAVIPFLVVAATSFAKIAIVLFLVRNALGIQQTPPAVLLNTVALVLTLYIMAPVLRDMYAVVTDPRQDFETIAGLEAMGREMIEPLVAFLSTHARPETIDFFIETTTQLWAGAANPVAPAQRDDILILLPAFLVSELTRAFEIGFLLYLPFLVIDFVISVVIVAMGMSMLSPTVISTPLKLLLFVFVDGWTRLMQGLVLSYAPMGAT
ncbi:type III secretion system export apparatus subunit SctR [Salinarimonas chemoclinalis]|uniref:type III secretion system export apparatus subunit SctR n=1 Tax=Salinarimonas chemoclinalis TaxID=3241599 RepID=UPI0035571B9E